MIFYLRTVVNCKTAPEQASKFTNPLELQSSTAGHELPYSTDDTYQTIINFARAGMN